MKKYTVIDIGGTAVKYALLDEEGNVLEHDSAPTPADLDSLTFLIEKIHQKYACEKCNGTAISAPGRINPETGWFHTGGALTYLDHTDYGNILKERLGCPVSIINDAKAAALAEVWKGSMQGVWQGLVLVLGTGIGGALIMEGKVCSGFSDTAGEVSFISTDWNQPYASEKTWAYYGSASALIRKYAEAVHRDPASCNGKILFENALAGEKEALQVLHDYCASFTAGLFSLQAVLDMEKTAIGGGISAQKLLFDILQEEIDRAYAPLEGKVPMHKPVIVPCQFGNDANLIGALYHFLQLYQK